MPLATYTYNGRGERVIKQDSGTTLYYYNQSGQLLAELDGSGDTLREYVYLNGLPVALINGAGVNFIHTDHLGTPQVLTDENQQVVWEADYEPFGEADITTEAVTNNLRFPGQYFDQETGLSYNLNRYYSTDIGRYITSDRLGIDGGLNSYLYTKANPLRFTDPLGLCPCSGSEWKLDPNLSDWTLSLALGGYFSAGGVTLDCKGDPSLTCTASVFCIGGGPIIGGGVTWGLAGTTYASDSDDLAGWSGWQFTASGGPASGNASASGGSPFSSDEPGQEGSASAGFAFKGGAAGIKCYTAHLNCSCPCDGGE